jgi:hypothetical protein
MHGSFDAMPRCRKARLLALLLPLGLFGCVQQPVEQRQPSGAAAMCQQEAQRLGYKVVQVGTPTQAPDGTEDVQILVQWGIDGASHIRCRYDRRYGVTLG